jgi:membrane fusion protein, multidrug efflux system
MHSPLPTKPVFTQSKVEPKRQASRQPRFTFWAGLALMVIILAVAVLHARGVFVQAPSRTIAPPPPQVAVSAPLQRDVDGRLEFLGQFSAVDHLELRAQVGGALTQIGFKDGDIVHKGDLLFVIDRVPYEIKLAQANAQLESATARLVLANRELARIQMLQARQVETAENLDQRAADQRAAQAAVDDAKAQIRDAQFDVDHCLIVAPFTGRIGSHLVSVGNLISGSRAGTSPTTLLATLVSIDPIYRNFDMSEADYMTFLRARQKQNGPLAENVQVSLSDETRFTHEGALDFVDNALDRSSGTIHARATVPNSDLLLTPGGFARVRLEAAPPAPAGAGRVRAAGSVGAHRPDSRAERRCDAEAGPDRRPPRWPEGHPLGSDAFRSGHHRRHPDRPAGLEGDAAQRIDPLRV